MRKTLLEMTRKNAVKLMNGDNMELLKGMPDNCVDSVVTDPPYGLSFMNKKWDHDVPSIEFWREVYRVLKPGGHVLSFGGTRTYHRMAVNIEDAGFEIRDQIQWIYGSGFPKSHNIGKSVDKIRGNEREWISVSPYKASEEAEKRSAGASQMNRTVHADITKGTSEWEGWGTALKPANEPICVARKPISEKTVADNVLKWGTGGFNIDYCRVATTDAFGGGAKATNIFESEGGYKGEGWEPGSELGRFPANVILECICDNVIPGEAGEVISSGGSLDNTNLSHEWGYKEIKRTTYTDKGAQHTNPMCPCRLLDEQSGGASRFFYCPKVSKKERNEGCEDLEEKKKEFETTTRTNKETADKFGCERKGTAKNTHPTVKPVDLMAYLCRLVTGPQGLVLDPFMGSGSTGRAAIQEGFRFAGMEMDKDYFEIAEKRIEYSYKKKYENGND